MVRLTIVLILFVSSFSKFSQARQLPGFQKQFDAVVTKYDQKNYKDAIVLLSAIEKTDQKVLSGLAQYHLIKGRLLHYADDLKESNSHFLIARSMYSARNNPRQVAHIDGRIAVNLTQIGHFAEAEKYVRQSMAYYKNNTADVDYVETRSDLGTIYLNTGDYLKAAEIYLENLRYFEKSGTIAQKGRAYSQIGLAYDYAGLNQKAESYYVQAVAFREHAKDTVGLMNTYNNLGIVTKNQQEYRKALTFYKRSYHLADLSKRETYKINPLINMGVASRHLGDLKEAIGYYDEALSISRKFKRESQIATIGNNLAFLYNETGQFERAQPLAKEAVEFAEVKGTLEDKAEYWQIYSVALNGLKKNSDAYQALLKSRAYSDSLYKTENSKAMVDISTKYETEKKEQQIRLLNVRNQLQLLNLKNQGLELETQKLDINNKNLLIQQKESDIRQKSLESIQQSQEITSLNQQSTIQKLQIRQSNILLIIAAVLLIFFVAIGYLIYNRRKLKERARLQAEISRQQELAARAVLDAEEQERRRIAGDLHDGVGQMLSTALMNLNSLVDQFDYKTENEREKAQNVVSLMNESYDEMRSISHQMMPNALIKSGLATALREFVNKIDKEKIRVSLETTGLMERIEEQTESIIYRVIQESVSNVIKHSGASKLDIQVLKDEDGLSVTLEDNGKGFDVRDLASAKGIGMKNIYSRIEYLKGTVDIDSGQGRGTLIAIHVPA